MNGFYDKNIEPTTDRVAVACNKQLLFVQGDALPLSLSRIARFCSHQSGRDTTRCHDLSPGGAGEPAEGQRTAWAVHSRNCWWTFKHLGVVEFFGWFDGVWLGGRYLYIICIYIYIYYYIYYIHLFIYYYIIYTIYMRKPWSNQFLNDRISVMGWNLGRVQHIWSKEKDIQWARIFMIPALKVGQHNTSSSLSSWFSPSSCPSTSPSRLFKLFLCTQKNCPSQIHITSPITMNLHPTWLHSCDLWNWGPGPNHTFQADLYAPLALPCILVGDSKLGGISTTVCAYEALKVGMVLMGWWDFME